MTSLERICMIYEDNTLRYGRTNPYELATL